MAIGVQGSGGRPKWALAAAAVAVVFGLATIVSGGRVLFGGDAARAAAGDYVPFVVWFNFLAGFAYVLAGIGLATWRRWSAVLAAAIAAATVGVAVAFAAHAMSGAAFEARTAAAMALRVAVWIAIAAAACRTLGCRPQGVGSTP